VGERALAIAPGSGVAPLALPQGGSVAAQSVTIREWRGTELKVRITGSAKEEYGVAARAAPRMEENTIHIFSLASGALYERLQRVMMQSVMKNTHSKVKFWLLSNYASPQWKAAAPVFAKNLGVEIEFVTYQWPSWLRKQTEKQRVMWAYKVLFLDVLFPAEVPKVIFVDADAVVRADIMELWDHDLGGAPYGYTPFCNSNPETKGFRFWAQQWWMDHLGGRPYHISALYVVDLVTFRRLRAGDRLRETYNDLTRDPNSLANLDQDLPNYAQHSIPIASLPQEWLWCGTWCSGESKADAKVIDLCNNPLHKTPKLDMARSIIEEWTGLDANSDRLLASNATA